MDDALHQLILRLHEVVDRLESLAQERRPVAVENFEGYSIVYLSDGSILGECANAAAGWEELSPLPGTRRAREMESSAPEDESGYWWCPECLVEVDPRCVTHDEAHDACGTPVNRKSPRPPADYHDSLDNTTALAAVVEAAQRLRRHDKVFRRPRFVPASPVWKQLFMDLMDALAALERQQGEDVSPKGPRRWRWFRPLKEASKLETEPEHVEYFNAATGETIEHTGGTAYWKDGAMDADIHERYAEARALLREGAEDG